MLGDFPASINRWLQWTAEETAMYKTRVPGNFPMEFQSIGSSESVYPSLGCVWPVINATEELQSRCVIGMPVNAEVASATVRPGMIS